MYLAAEEGLDGSNEDTNHCKTASAILNTRSRRAQDGQMQLFFWLQIES